jgi:hypothetical protein
VKHTILENALILAFVALCSVPGITKLYADPQEQQIEEPAALCDTDSDCLKHCPPPADDPDCDGGPSDVSFNRGNYGSQP